MGDCGISSSLPLTSLNFYGDPIPSTQSLDPNSPRLTMDQCTIVAFGSFLSKWDPLDPKLASAAKCLILIGSLSPVEVTISYNKANRKAQVRAASARAFNVRSKL